MAIFIKTSMPSKLLTDIKSQIKNGQIDSWSVDNDGDFTHNVVQWRYKAWLRPHVEDGRLVMGILCRTDKNISVSEYAIYHGRFVEMILAHFDNRCSDIITTAMPTKYDTISNPK